MTPDAEAKARALAKAALRVGGAFPDESPMPKDCGCLTCQARALLAALDAEPTALLGISVKLDSTMPLDEVRLAQTDGKGNVTDVGRIVNVPSAPAHALDEVADWHTFGPERDAAALAAFKETT